MSLNEVKDILFSYIDIECAYDFAELLNDNHLRGLYIERLMREKYVVDFVPGVSYNQAYYNKLIDIFAKYNIDITHFVKQIFIRCISWDMISILPLNKEFISEYGDMLVWDRLLRNNKIPKILLNKFNDKIDWSYVVIYQDADDKIINRYINRIEWDFVNNSDTTEEVITKYLSNFDLAELSYRTDFSLETIAENYRGVLNYDRFYEYNAYRITDEYIDLYADRLNWDSLLKYKTLSEDVMNRHADRLMWERVSKNKNLSLDFIDRHADNLDWVYITWQIDLPFDFIIKHKDRIKWEYLLRRRDLTKEMFLKYVSIFPDKLDLPEEFISFV